MDRLQAMQVFVRVVEADGFAKAAKSLSIPRSTVSRAIQDLEAHLKRRLLQRTTRTLSLTPDGSLYYDHCRRILGEIDAVEASLSGAAARPSGRLRVDMTASFARLFILPAIRGFQESYPDIDLTLTLNDRPVDLVQDGVDCVLRAGIPDSSALLVARRIASFDWVICASPRYLEERGVPASLEDLGQHQAVRFLSGRTGRAVDWHFVVDGEGRAVRVPGILAVDDTDAYVACGLEGLGLIRIASYTAQPHLRAGRLVRVLGEYTAPSVPLSILYPRNRHLSPAVRAFADWVIPLVRGHEADWRQLPPGR